VIAAAPPSAPPATDPPLAETLRRLRERIPFLDIRLGRPGGPDWLSPAELTDPASPHLERLLAAIAAARGTDRRDVPASFFVHGYSWLLAAAGVGAYLLDRRLPSLDQPSVLVRFSPEGQPAALALLADRFLALPDDPAAAQTGATTVPDTAALRDALRAALAEHLAPLIAAVRPKAALGPRAMWLLAADNLAWTVVHHAGPEPDGAWSHAEVAALTQAVDSPFRGRTRVVEVERGGRRGRFVARGSCCLNDKLPGQTRCATCPLLSDRERQTRLEETLAP